MSSKEQLYDLALFPRTGNRAAWNRPPKGFGSMEMSEDQQRLLQRLAIETFTSMANDGHPLANCLAAVMLTGMNFAVETLNA